MANQVGEDCASGILGAPCGNRTTKFDGQINNGTTINVGGTWNVAFGNGDDHDVDYTLPLASKNRFQVITFKWNHVADDPGTFQIAVQAGDTIESIDGTVGAGPVSITEQDWVTYTSDGTTWWLIGAGGPSAIINAQLANPLYTVPKFGGYLTDADVTVQPFTDKVGIYVLRNGVLTTNRALTLGITGVLSSAIVRVVVEDTTANTYTIKNSVGGTLFTHQGSVTGPMLYELFISGGQWIVSIRQYATAAV